MQISIDIGTTPSSTPPDVIKNPNRYCSIRRFVYLVVILFVVSIALYLCKKYLKTVLYWLENQDSAIVSLTIVVLFVVVSFPLSVGYIVVVGAAGYLFGIVRGFCLSVVGANVGILVAHNTIKLLGHHQKVRRLIENDTAAAIMRVLSGPSCFRIILCARLTPIPFGLQNVIFALSNVNAQIYHFASCIGLFAGQFVGVYVGSTLRSMQDVLENNHFSTETYVFAGAQLVLAAALIVWFGAKARAELTKALSEAESKLPIGEKPGKLVYGIP